MVKRKRTPKMKCPFCKRGQIYHRKTFDNWKCYRCRKVISWK